MPKRERGEEEFPYEPNNPYSPWFGLSENGEEMQFITVNDNAIRNPPNYEIYDDEQLTIMIKNGEKRILEDQGELNQIHKEYDGYDYDVKSTVDGRIKYLENRIQGYRAGIQKLVNKRAVIEDPTAFSSIFSSGYNNVFNSNKNINYDSANKKKRLESKNLPSYGGKRTKRSRKSKRTRKSRKTKRSRKSKQSRKI